jgi:hypothetical protein
MDDEELPSRDRDGGQRGGLPPSRDREGGQRGGLPPSTDGLFVAAEGLLAGGVPLGLAVAAAATALRLRASVGPVGVAGLVVTLVTLPPLLAVVVLVHAGHDYRQFLARGHGPVAEPTAATGWRLLEVVLAGSYLALVLWTAVPVLASGSGGVRAVALVGPGVVLAPVPLVVLVLVRVTSTVAPARLP